MTALTLGDLILEINQKLDSEDALNLKLASFEGEETYMVELLGSMSKARKFLFFLICLAAFLVVGVGVGVYVLVCKKKETEKLEGYTNPENTTIHKKGEIHTALAGDNTLNAGDNTIGNGGDDSQLKA